MSSSPTHPETLDRLNKALHAFVRVGRNAQPSVAEGPLHGWNIAIKDCFDLAGEIASVGTPMFSARRATRTGTAVQRLLDAGPASSATPRWSNWPLAAGASTPL
jgi:Asp-tRNA(Asn)/Glu-tRNA(Gln) amidotransferase A subunit family amidase